MQTPSLPGKDVLRPAPEPLEAENTALCGQPGSRPKYTVVCPQEGAVFQLAWMLQSTQLARPLRYRGSLKEGHVGLLALPGQCDNYIGLFCSVGWGAYKTSAITALSHSGIRDHDRRIMNEVFEE